MALRVLRMPDGTTRLVDQNGNPVRRRISKQSADQSTTNAPPTPSQDKSSATQPTRKLPTDRIAYQKQLDILRAYGLASQGGTRAVSSKEAADVVGLSPTTVPLLNTFMTDNSFVEKSGTDFVPHRALVEFAQAHSWNAETAPRKLAPLIRQTWFGSRLLTRLAFSVMSLEEAVADLGSQISAAPEFKAQIETLVDYTVSAGLVKRDGNQLSLGDVANPAHLQEAKSQPEKSTSTEAADQRVEPPSRLPGAVATGFMSTEGGIQFHVSIKVDMKEMSGWAPERISAFFSGMAQVLAAKKGTESV
jgi:hypothetical protein